jgi:hypothetical protein
MSRVHAVIAVNAAVMAAVYAAVVVVVVTAVFHSFNRVLLLIVATSQTNSHN